LIIMSCCLTTRTCQSSRTSVRQYHKITTVLHALYQNQMY